ncbi:putative cell-cycle checkpoint protein kinase [Talaromyces proteolyticus]|uniref:Cell-cycle checkpoint protein kinase n=1 Tax=Talaromyces proteolyticus TaxID=1131652 RepID=A0AAD4KSZ7_9EURO|nr:putative cell-cycle checkpoint protein kinase [Talaromyces proteolyticus]KAH8698260.1 putative cell-cycle checkpoint protein kinase [Talaromyces proteolyticus]
MFRRLCGELAACCHYWSAVATSNYQAHPHHLYSLRRVAGRKVLAFYAWRVRMAPRSEKSSLKRGRASLDNQAQDSKKPRRSERISSQTTATTGKTPIKNTYLPTPLTHHDSTATDIQKDLTATPDVRHTPLSEEQLPAFSSPPGDTQALSQFVYPPRAFADDVEDEAAEGVWGYLIPLDDKSGASLALKKRNNCETSPCIQSTDTKTNTSSKISKSQSKSLNSGENKDSPDLPPSGYLIGRHPECDLVLNIPTISNRHCLIFNEIRNGDVVAVLEDLSSNGTFVNEAILGRNKHRELEDGDEVTIIDEARFVFRYPRTRDTNGFRQQYRILQQLGKGHFATVYLCVERATGTKYAVKVFERRQSESQKSQSDTLQQEIALLMSVNHPNVLCLKDTFDERDGAYLVLELAPDGELFNYIVANSKLSENDTRKVFIQLFQGLKYLHDRGIVHRDIKPENILLADKNLTVKLADFGLAKIIGEDSFTTTLCGTPSYVAPEILEESRHRRYTKAVDIWSLGVVLYICLCGFPPFSDELYTPEYPYNLAQQIRMARFDYPSPYWDSVGDVALDLIDRMLTVNVEHRITVDECLEHPWITGNGPSITDSTDGLTGAMNNLDFSKRKVERERTLLSTINDVQLSTIVQDDDSQVKIFRKNAAGKRVHNHAGQKKGHHEPSPSANRPPTDFINMGGRGDPVLFEEDPDSRYPRDKR